MDRLRKTRVTLLLNENKIVMIWFFIRRWFPTDGRRRCGRRRWFCGRSHSRKSRLQMPLEVIGFRRRRRLRQWAVRRRLQVFTTRRRRFIANFPFNRCRTSCATSRSASVCWSLLLLLWRLIMTVTLVV